MYFTIHFYEYFSPIYVKYKVFFICIDVLQELHSCLLEDQQCYTSLREDVDMLENILEAQGRCVASCL